MSIYLRDVVQYHAETVHNHFYPWPLYLCKSISNSCCRYKYILIEIVKNWHFTNYSPYIPMMGECCKLCSFFFLLANICSWVSFHSTICYGHTTVSHSWIQKKISSLNCKNHVRLLQTITLQNFLGIYTWCKYEIGWD